MRKLAQAILLGSALILSGCDEQQPSFQVTSTVPLKLRDKAVLETLNSESTIKSSMTILGKKHTFDVYKALDIICAQEYCNFEKKKTHIGSQTIFDSIDDAQKRVDLSLKIHGRPRLFGLKEDPKTEKQREDEKRRLEFKWHEYRKIDEAIDKRLVR